MVSANFASRHWPLDIIVISVPYPPIPASERIVPRDYSCGDKIKVRVVLFCISVRVTAPFCSGEEVCKLEVLKNILWPPTFKGESITRPCPPGFGQGKDFSIPFVKMICAILR